MTERPIYLFSSVTMIIDVMFVFEVSQFIEACITKYRNLVAYEKQKLISHSSGAGSPECRPVWGLVKSFSQVAELTLCPHVVEGLGPLWNSINRIHEDLALMTQSPSRGPSSSSHPIRSQDLTQEFGGNINIQTIATGWLPVLLDLKLNQSKKYLSSFFSWLI